MAAQKNEETRLAFESLSRGAFLDVLLPRDPALDLATILKDGSLEEIGRVPSRRTLFFGA